METDHHSDWFMRKSIDKRVYDKNFDGIFTKKEFNHQSGTYRCPRSGDDLEEGDQPGGPDSAQGDCDGGTEVGQGGGVGLPPREPIDGRDQDAERCRLEGVEEEYPEGEDCEDEEVQQGHARAGDRP